MERLVVVFDTDTTRASRTVAALQSRCISGIVTLLYIDAISDLHKQLAAYEVSIVFFDVRSVVRDTQARSLDTLEALHQALHVGVQDQVVYTGANEQAIVAVGRGNYAFLLPLHASVVEFLLVLDRALERRGKYLERPFVIKTKRNTRVVWPNRVSFVESTLCKAHLHVRDRIVEAYAKLSDLMQKLPSRHVQSYKSYVVNMAFIKELAQDDALLTTREHAPISQQHRKPMHEAFHVGISSHQVKIMISYTWRCFDKAKLDQGMQGISAIFVLMSSDITIILKINDIRENTLQVKRNGCKNS